MRFIITTAAAALLSTTAFAADAVYSYEPAPVAFAEVPAYTWTGAYIGLNAGYGGGKLKANGVAVDEFDEFDPVRLDLGFTGSGFVGGAQAGYNWQSDSFVYGIETDIQYSGIEAETSASYSDGLDSASGSVGGSIDWFGTTRARLGFTPTDRFMVYATGGVAYGKMEVFAEGAINGVGGRIDASKTKVGWTAGAGAEYAIDNNWSLKTEYLYTDLGKWTFAEGYIDNGVYGSADANFKFHTVRAGINYKF